MLFLKTRTIVSCSVLADTKFNLKMHFTFIIANVKANTLAFKQPNDALPRYTQNDLCAFNRNETPQHFQLFLSVSVSVSVPISLISSLRIFYLIDCVLVCLFRHRKSEQAGKTVFSWYSNSYGKLKLTSIESIEKAINISKIIFKCLVCNKCSLCN